MAVVNGFIQIVLQIEFQDIILPHEYIRRPRLIGAFLLQMLTKRTILCSFNTFIKRLFNTFKVHYNPLNTSEPLI